MPAIWPMRLGTRFSAFLLTELTKSEFGYFDAPIVMVFQRWLTPLTETPYRELDIGTTCGVHSTSSIVTAASGPVAGAAKFCVSPSPAAGAETGAGAPARPLSLAPAGLAA